MFFIIEGSQLYSVTCRCKAIGNSCLHIDSKLQTYLNGQCLDPIWHFFIMLQWMPNSLSSCSGSSSPVPDHPSVSWDTSHRGVWSHLAHVAAGHRPLSDRLHQDPETCLQQRGEETQVTTGKRREILCMKRSESKKKKETRSGKAVQKIKGKWFKEGERGRREGEIQQRTEEEKQEFNTPRKSG